MEIKRYRSISASKGFSVVEVLVAFSLFALITVGMTSAYVLFSQSHPASGNRARAVFLAEEGLEAVRNIADESFSNLIDGVYGLATTSNQWVFSGSSDTSGIYTRAITVSTVDSDIKTVESSVSWLNIDRQTSTVSLTTRFAYWDKIINLERFWSNATTSAVFDLAGIDNGIKVQILGNYAFVVRTSGNPRFSIFDISDPYAPTVVSNPSLGSASPMNIFVSGNYAYVIGTQNNPEFQIVDISDPVSASVTGTYDASGNTDAYGVYAVGNYVYMTRLNSTAPEFYIINVSNPASPSLTGSLNLNGSSREVAVSGNYAYIASTDDNQELQVINITNPNAPTLAGSLNLAGTADALTIAIFGSTVLLGQGTSLRIIDVSTPATPTLIGTFNAGGNVNDIAINLANGNIYAFIATSNATNEFQVVDISTPVSPVRLIGLNTLSILNGIAYDPSLDISVAVSSADTEEAVIFIPQ